MAQGNTLDGITRAVVETKAQNYTDGVVQTTRQGAETLARTVTNGVTNSARDELCERNSDIISALRFTAVLDARTSEICASLDGNEYAPNDMSRPFPPMHPNAVIEGTMISCVDGVRGYRKKVPGRGTWC